ncbi:phosphate ABC transporter permease PstA [Akkermansia glycaniphila]|uniref:phosphate ABC transporter permease PstA n=1 Tax=Akkermansia glycaniphila TaxID=1679444 RepID=UPI001C00EB8B|nr:phosphate ABC transporter permease PstA [Akkermansia glycaniphila]MBT9448600.1 phosphate ABC transporter permease PstA [Akkermansia glycaniphila]
MNALALKKDMPRRPMAFRKLTDLLIRLFSLFSIAVAVGGMAWILYTVIGHGVKVIDWSFLTNESKPYGTPESGIANALLGSLYITLGAAAIAVPLAMAAGIYLSEYGKNSRLAHILRFSANVMMGMPSIIVGLFVYVLLVVSTGNFSGFAGTVSLAIIMFPVVMRTTEDMLAMVPYTLRESALALGMTRTRTTLCIITRSAKNGLVTGILLSLARVSGETAPLLFTAMFADSWPTAYFSQPTANMPVLINEYTMNSPFEAMHSAGWGAALVMAGFILIVNILTRIIFHDNKQKH